MLRTAIAAALAGTPCFALAQQAPPSTGQILQNLERSLPTRPMTTPEGITIDVPEAPAASDDALLESAQVNGYRIVGNTVFDEETLLKAVAERTGKMTLGEVAQVANELTKYYRRHGYFVAQAYLPEQTIENGIVTLAVLEGRYDSIVSHGRTGVSDARVRKILGSAICPKGSECQGALVRLKPLERGLLVLNDTPGVAAAARLAPGQKTGTSTLDVEVRPDQAVTTELTLDNGGNYYTGSLRVIGNAWIDSLAGIGDQLTLQGVTSADGGRLYYGSVGYSLPVGYNGLRAGVRGWGMHYRLGDVYEPLDAHGRVYGGDATFSYPILRSRSANLYGSLSYGERNFRDYADAVGAVSDRAVEDRAEAALSGDFADSAFGRPAMNGFALSYTRGRLALDPVLALIDALTARTAGRYEKLALSYQRLQQVTSRSSIYLRAQGQYAADNLDSYEKLALGGPDAVRAYPVGEGQVDKGAIASVEWRRHLGSLAGGAMTGSLFYDYAEGRINAKPWLSAANNKIKLEGAGVGLAWSPKDRATLRLFAAYRGDREWTAAPDRRVAYGISFSTTF